MSFKRRSVEVHRELRTAKYRQRVVKLKTAYKRKSKHAKQLNEMSC